MTRWLAMVMLTAPRLAWADTAAVGPAEAGVAAFTAAYRAWDAGRFGVASSFFRQAASNAPASSTNFYWWGAAEFHRMLHLQNQPGARTNQTAATEAREAAIGALSRAVALDPRDAESHALLGTLYGIKIDGNLLRAARLGPRIGQYRQAALATGPDNPRVRYLLGTCQFHTARTRASRRETLATFLQAESLFLAEEQRPAGPLEPRWGYASCLTFIGRTYELLGRRAEAASYFRQALARQPSDYLAREGLARVTHIP